MTGNTADEAHNSASWLVDRHVAEGRGGRVAVRCDGVDTTYAQLQAEMFRVQNVLQTVGVAPGERVAMVVNDDLTFPSWFLGSQRSAVVPVPLSTMLGAAELGPIIADSGAVALVLSAEYAAMVEPILAVAPAVHTVIVDDDVVQQSEKISMLSWQQLADRTPQPVAETNVSTPGFWLYSSGTTGLPKGVMHLQGSLRATAETYGAGVLQIGEDDRFLSIAKLFFAYGLGNSLTFPFAVGATAVLNPHRPTPAAFVELLTNEKPSLFFASPGFLAAMMDAGAPPEAFASVRATMTAGESLPADVQTRFASLSGTPVLDGIGSTELLHIFISNTLTQQAPGSSGVPVPGYEAELRDADDVVVTEPDTPGFLHVRGPSSAVGYHERSEASAAAFREGWVRTGDVYTCSKNGYWTFLGRNNDMIKAGGIWVSPAEVESALIEHVDVLEVAVVGDRDDVGLEEVVAFVVPTTGAHLDLDDLDRHCRERMAAFKRPRRILVVDALPRTATGKVQRFALRDTLSGSAQP